jgi:hypothetical protein
VGAVGSWLYCALANEVLDEPAEWIVLTAIWQDFSKAPL